MATFIDGAVQDIDNRIKELKAEQERLQAARDLLVGPSRRGPGRPAGTGGRQSRATRKPSGRPRRRRGADTRADQALELVRTQPGVTIPQIAESLKIQPNYLYRVMPKLTSAGLVKRSGQSWYPVAEKAS